MNYIHLQVDEKIARLTIQHPPVNALNEATLKELDLVLDQIKEDDKIKVIILSGEGKCFVAGADIKEFLQAERDQGAELSRLGQRVFDKLEASTKPVIAAINGACLGGGLELALACHIRIVADSAKMGLPELNLGLIPGYGGTQRLSRLIGKERALDLILSSRFVTGTEAEQWGLVSRVVPLDSLVEEATAMANVIASKSAVALRLALQAVYQGGEVSLTDGLELEAKLFAEAFQSEDMVEGVHAFLEKRSPEFKDR